MKRILKAILTFLTGLMIIGLAASSAAAANCESLASLKLTNTTITSSNTVAAGAFTPPTTGPPGTATSQFSNLPAFCRVAATLTPSSDSDIKVEVWLPASGWNGKFQAVGNGGWGGVISYSAMGDAGRAGDAAASTEPGHVGGRRTFALGPPVKLIDFGYRAVH